MPVAIAIEKSTNKKIGDAHATYVSQASCPSSCVFQGAGCYAEHGPLGIHTRRLNRDSVTGITPKQLAEAEADAIRSKLSGTRHLRLHVVGDCKTDKAASIVAEAALATMKPGKQVWSYTHAWEDVDPKSWGAVSVLASTESPKQIESALDLGWGTAIVVDSFKDTKLYKDGNAKILPCPQQTQPDVKCVDCRLCFNADRLRAKGITIGFSAHGTLTKAVSETVQLARRTK